MALGQIARLQSGGNGVGCRVGVHLRGEGVIASCGTQPWTEKESKARNFNYEIQSDIFDGRFLQEMPPKQLGTTGGHREKEKDQSWKARSNPRRCTSRLSNAARPRKGNRPDKCEVGARTRKFRHDYEAPADVGISETRTPVRIYQCEFVAAPSGPPLFLENAGRRFGTLFA
jgi:hypothetical protein